ncbi:hypothetical protein CHS0354_018438 [Potamilus streckersoni]|uniref:Phage protein n=1 Tax=Potamilus streckersoni TaxID=2493646 RepID=A0AAE0TBL3_9BIVA|nr:hypothetical protein CHS0354_018438 [Potamilus streckersoni]
MIASLEAESVKDPEKGLLVLTSVSSALEKIARSYQRINKPVNRLAVAMEVIQLIGDAVSKAPKHKTGRENFEGILTEIGAECVRRLISMDNSVTSRRFLKELKEYGDKLRQERDRADDNFPTDAASVRRRRAKAAGDYRMFCRTYFPHYITSDNFSEFQQFTFERFPAWLKQEKGSQIILTAPRGEAKSTLITQLGTLWAVLHGLRRMVVIMMDSEAQSAAMLASVRSELENNPGLAIDFPEAAGIGPVWQRTQIITRNGCKIKASSVGKRIRGMKHGAFRPDLVILDDIENDTNVLSKEQRDRLEAWVDSTVLNLGPPDGSMTLLWVGTVLHPDAVIRRQSAKPNRQAYNFRAIPEWPARMDLWEKWESLFKQNPHQASEFYRRAQRELESGAKVSWPAVRPLLKLMELRAAGHDAFAREFQNEPVSSHAVVSEFTYYTPDQLPADCISLGAVDPSLGKTLKSDYSALLTGQFHRASGVLYITDTVIARLTPDVQIARIIELQRVRQCAVWAVEAVQFQHFYAEQLRRISLTEGCPVPVIPVIPKDSKDSRIMSVLPFVRSGHIRFLHSHTALTEQIRNWGQGSHDDGPDALSMLWKQAFTAAGRVEYTPIVPPAYESEENIL